MKLNDFDDSVRLIAEAGTGFNNIGALYEIRVQQKTADQITTQLDYGGGRGDNQNNNSGAATGTGNNPNTVTQGQAKNTNNSIK